ncbi:MAG: histidinol-phosphate aminotransferase family protein [Kiritimatiellae bacterium]|nr:histidinol-phosphate aminotransferase family protein [Kiritimatiellia bacterium]
MNYLDRNEFNFPLSPNVMAAVRNFNPDLLCFYTRIYDEGKKSVVSVRLSEIYGVPEKQVLLGYGGEDILKNAVHFYLTAGGGNSIMIPEFSWWYYNRIASECGGVTKMYPLYESDDTFRYDVDELIALAQQNRPRMLLLASPNNPTGNSLTSAEIGKIMEGVPAETIVLVDEAYASFITTDTDYIAPLVNRYDNLIICRTLSKFYGLPGLRMGFGFMGKNHDDFLNYANKYLGYNRFSEEVALAALESDAYYRGVADQMDWGRRLFQDKLGKLPGFKVYRSVANFILIKYPEGLKAPLQASLAAKDCKIKFMTDKGLESCVRITLGRPEQVQTVCDTILNEWNNAKE